MALNNNTNFPPSGPAPYRIDRTWCLGDSLPYLNANFTNFDTRIDANTTAIAAASATLNTTIASTSAATIIQAQPAGCILQTFSVTTDATTSISNTYSVGSTKPQYNANNIILSQPITTTGNSNKILIQALVSGGNTSGTGAQNYVVALFNTTAGDAIASQIYYESNVGSTYPFTFLHTPGTAGTYTYRLGVGATSSGPFNLNSRFNITNSNLGGLHISSMLIQEIKG